MLELRRTYNFTISLKIDINFLEECQKEINEIGINYPLVLAEIETIAQQKTPERLIKNLGIKDTFRVIAKIERLINQKLLSRIQWEGYDDYEDYLVNL